MYFHVQILPKQDIFVTSRAFATTESRRGNDCNKT